MIWMKCEWSKIVVLLHFVAEVSEGRIFVVSKTTSSADVDVGFFDVFSFLEAGEVPQQQVVVEVGLFNAV